MNENQTVTIEQAISRGNWQLLAFPLAVMVTGIGLGSYVALQMQNYQWIPIVAGVLGGLILAGAIWNYYVIKWKIWAYSGIDDIATLKRIAVQRGMIYEPDSIFSKLEFISKQTTELLDKLEQEAYARFKKNGVADDPTLPETYVVYYSNSVYGYALMAVFFIAMGIWMWVDENESRSGNGMLLKYVSIPFAAYMLYEFYKRYKLINKPLLVFTNTGLYQHKDGETYYPWNEVYPFRTIKYGDTVYLQITTIGSTTELEYEFKESEMRLHYLYRIYSHRHKRMFPELYKDQDIEETDEELE